MLVARRCFVGAWWRVVKCCPAAFPRKVAAVTLNSLNSPYPFAIANIPWWQNVLLMFTWRWRQACSFWTNLSYTHTCINWGVPGAWATKSLSLLAERLQADMAKMRSLPDASPPPREHRTFPSVLSIYPRIKKTAERNFSARPIKAQVWNRYQIYGRAFLKGILPLCLSC